MQKKKEKRSIALFGGAFDPPHFGHALAIRQILDTGLFQAVWVTPTGARPDKVSRASAEDRRAMVKVFLQELFVNEPVVLAEHLLDADKPLPTTIDELRYLARVHPDTRFSVAIGRDQAEALERWHAFEQLARMAHFLVLTRDGVPVSIPKGVEATVLDPAGAAWMNISSTDIRARLRDHRSIAGMVPRGVLRIIERKHLYTSTTVHPACPEKIRGEPVEGLRTSTSTTLSTSRKEQQ